MHVYLCTTIYYCISKEGRIGLGDYFRIEIRCMEDVHKNTIRDHLSNCLRRFKVFLIIKTILIIFHIDKENLMSKPESESKTQRNFSTAVALRKICFAILRFCIKRHFYCNILNSSTCRHFFHIIWSALPYYFMCYRCIVSSVRV